MANVNPLPIVAENENGVETNPPAPPYSGDTPQPGNPDQPQLSAGIIKNTSIEASNNNRSHVCDTTLFVRRNVSLAAVFEPTIRTIRAAITKILQALGITPGSNGLVEQIKKIKRYVDDITKFLKKVQKALDALVVVVKKINDLINYILSLPARLLALFANCLKELYAELKAQFTDVVKAAAGVEEKNDGESVLKEARQLLNSTKQLVNTASRTAAQVTSLPASTVNAITSPSGTTLTDAQAKDLTTNLFSSFDTSKSYGKA